jgi:chromosome segregation ATPase
MDAISFVFGVKSGQLRASQLRELVHRREHQSEEDIADETYAGQLQLFF